MEEIITSILETERFADDIVKNAADNAKNIMIYAENKADAIKEQAIADFKTHRKSVIESAEKKAETLYLKRIEEGKADAEKLILSVKDRLNGAADKIVSEIVG